MPPADPTPARRSWPQRALIASTAVALGAALVTAGALAYSNSRLSRLPRLALADDLRTEEVAEGDPLNYLIVGIDDASGLDPDDSVRQARPAGGLHTDTIMVLRVDPEEETAQLLSLPRDLWVPIADLGTEQRINVALSTEGPGRLIRTIDENFGIPIHHYVQVDMAGFRGLVDVVGGVPVHFPRPARSVDAGLAIEAAGCYTLGPAQALGFARAREDYQVQDASGEWHTDPRSDFSRVERQQLFVELALRQAIARGARSPNTMRRLVELGIDNVLVDDALEAGSVIDLGNAFRDFDPDDLETHTLPVADEVIGGAQVLRLQEEAAEATLALFRGGDATDPAGMDPGEVTIQVLNGTGVQGQGGEATETLISAGFEAIVSADAPEAGGVTTVRYVAGSEAQARLLATHVVGPVAYEEVDATGGADVVVVTGTDWEGATAEARPADDVPGPTTTTTSTTTTAPVDDAEATATTAPEAEAPATVDDVDDPSDPLFFRARGPDPGEECPTTA